MMGWLLAKAGDDPLMRPEIAWGTVALVAAMLAGAAVIYAADRWRRRISAGPSDRLHELTSFRAMFEAGEITEAEYNELKRKLTEKAKKATAAATTAPTAETPRPTGTAPEAPAPSAGQSPELPPPPATA
ncbi:MAG: SHOCT domain-containing protein [Gemmataceae bacterium]|nr:SHOCT domain-containing protein [Gemmata sp.]MDW8197132.1 SHOCT domain-containing protein [Gemmataceae bacterium]